MARTDDTTPRPIAVAGPSVGGQSRTSPADGATSAPAAGSGSTAATARSGSANPQAPLPPSQGGPSSTTPPRQSATAEAGPRSPILLASVGTYSGPVGTVFEPILKGAQLWVTAANA